MSDVLVHPLDAEQVVADSVLVVPPGQFIPSHGISLCMEGLVVRTEVAIEDLDLFGYELIRILEHELLDLQMFEDAHFVLADR